MPVYNGEKYLEASIKSIMFQTFKDFELVCVDDGSTDESWEIMRMLKFRELRIKTFRKPHGGNVPKSWNFVLPYLKGDFIMYMSQDDFMSEDNLEKLIQRQKETGADCVLPDMIWHNSNREPLIGDRDIILTGKEAFKLSLNWQIHGFGLWERELFNDIHFIESAWDSDELVTRKLFLKCKKVAFCDGKFFYNQSENSITRLRKPTLFTKLLLWKLILLNL